MAGNGLPVSDERFVHAAGEPVKVDSRPAVLSSEGPEALRPEVIATRIEEGQDAAGSKDSPEFLDRARRDVAWKFMKEEAGAHRIEALVQKREFFSQSLHEPSVRGALARDLKKVRRRVDPHDVPGPELGERGSEAPRAASDIQHLTESTWAKELLGDASHARSHRGDPAKHGNLETGVIPASDRMRVVAVGKAVKRAQGVAREDHSRKTLG